MSNVREIDRIRRKFRALRPEMDERIRRQWAATEARELGWGGVTIVARATGLSRTTITTGMRELDLPDSEREAAAQRVRRPGAGRPRVVDVDPDLLAALEELIEPGREGTLSRRCAGRARARGGWPRN